MADTLHVAILNSSILMAGIASALRTRAGVRVFVSESVEALQRQLDQAGPTILLFDVATVAPSALQSLLRGSAGLTCIGLDLGTRQALTFASTPWPLSSLDDLVQLIDWMIGMNSAFTPVTRQEVQWLDGLQHGDKQR